MLCGGRQCPGHDSKESDTWQQAWVCSGGANENRNGVEEAVVHRVTIAHKVTTA